MQYRLNIPSGLDFSTLRLDYTPASGEVTYNNGALESLCAASGLPYEDIDADAQESMNLIAAWYEKHRSVGGAHDEAGAAVLHAVNSQKETNFSHLS